MDYENIVQMIGSLGFPIACCIVLFKQNNSLQETLNNLSTTLTTLTNKITEMSADIEDLKHK